MSKNRKKGDTIGADGHLLITTTNIETNITTIEVDEHNMIVDSGFELIPRSMNPNITFGAKLGELRFGNDTGIGTELNPTPPTKTLKPIDQHVIATVPVTSINYITTEDSISISISILGSELLGNKAFLKYTSAAIYTDDGQIFSYKRFPFRVISPDVRVNVTWKITFSDGGDGGGEVEPCPIPPQVVGTIIESNTSTINKGQEIIIRGYELFDDNSLKIVRNGSKWTTNNSNTTLTSATNGAIRVTGREVGSTILQLKSGDYIASSILQVLEPVVNEFLGINITSPLDEMYVGELMVAQATLTSGGTSTNVTGLGNWTVSPNLTIESTNSTDIKIRITSVGESYITVTHNGKVDTFQFQAKLRQKATLIQLRPIGDTRFAVGTNLDFVPTIYFNDGTTRLANLTDRWVYDARSVKLEEVGTLGNMRLVAKYNGEGSIRVYVDGIEGKLEFNVADPIVTNSVYTFPQTPLHVIPDVHNYGSTVMGIQSEGDDMEIDKYYLTSSSPLMTFDDGIKVVGDGTYNIIVNKDGIVDQELVVISTTMTTMPLELVVGDFDYNEDNAGEVTLDIVSPTGTGVYIDVSNNSRRHYDTTKSVTIKCSPSDVLKIYGGAESIKITGAIGEITSWGDFECGGYQIKSPVLSRVPYTVPTVATMVNMFNGCTTFNQNLSAWCVTAHPTKPTGFDTGCTEWTKLKPIWGQCPDINDITDIVITDSSTLMLEVGETKTIMVKALNRLENVVNHDDSLFDIAYTDTVILPESNGGGEYAVTGLTVGVSQLTFSTAFSTATVDCEVT